MRNTPNYTLAEITIIHEMNKAGRSAREIAETLGEGRTAAGINALLWRERMKQSDAAESNKDSIADVTEPTVVIKQTVQKEMTPREMIKALWHKGYMIENNKLVVIIRTEVNLADIVRNG